MKFPRPLQSAVLLRRYKRFLADVRFPDGSLATAHCPNRGRLPGLAVAGANVWLSPTEGNKLSWRLELVESKTKALAGVHAARANHICAEALHNKVIPELSAYTRIRREVRLENRRIDFVLESNDAPTCFLEVKSVTFSRTSGLAEFPDSITTRGRHHVELLSRQAEKGVRSALLYVVQRSDCRVFSVAWDVDVEYARAVQAAESRVTFLVWGCTVTPADVSLTHPLQLRGMEARESCRSR